MVADAEKDDCAGERRDEIRSAWDEIENGIYGGSGAASRGRHGSEAAIFQSGEKDGPAGIVISCKRQQQIPPSQKTRVRMTERAAENGR